jgi:hypothetical protein
METREIQLRLEVKGADPTTGVVRVLDRSRAQRVGRALKVLALCWGVGAACVFIPLVHFVMPALLLVTGVVLAVLRWRDSASIVGLEVACPRCRLTGKLVSSGPIRDGGELHCDGCGFQVAMHFLPSRPPLVTAVAAQG